jgi:hypothetical protein
MTTREKRKETYARSTVGWTREVRHKGTSHRSRAVAPPERSGARPPCWLLDEGLGAQPSTQRKKKVTPAPNSPPPTQTPPSGAQRVAFGKSRCIPFLPTAIRHAAVQTT